MKKQLKIKEILMVLPCITVGDMARILKIMGEV